MKSSRLCSEERLPGPSVTPHSLSGMTSRCLARGMHALMRTLLIVGAIHSAAPAPLRARTPDIQAPTGDAQGVHATKASERETILTRTFKIPRSTLFDAMTRPEHLLQWMHASGMKLVACEMDARPGGGFRYVFERRSGRRLEVRGRYQRFEPPSRVVYEESYDFSPLQILVATAFEEVDGGTLMTQTLRYASRQERDGDFEPVVTSATESYANLERYLSRIAK